MVLLELGNKIQKAVAGITRKSNIDDDALDQMLKEIQRALLESDVNVKLVLNMRNNIKKKINFSSRILGKKVQKKSNRLRWPQNNKNVLGLEKWISSGGLRCLLAQNVQNFMLVSNFSDQHPQILRKRLHELFPS